MNVVRLSDPTSSTPVVDHSQLLREFSDAVEAMVEALPGDMTMGEVVGALEFVKFNLMNRSDGNG